MRVALRVEVGSLRGLRQGVPNLMRLFSEFQVRATFFFPLGRDFAGRYPLSTWRHRTRYGLKALTYGSLQVAPSLTAESLQLMKLAERNGHEVGLSGMSPQQWSRRMAHAAPSWVEDQFATMLAAYRQGGQHAIPAFAPPDWQTHPRLLRLLRPESVAFSSMSRGKLPYLPVLQGERSTVPEIPTTLPTIDELLEQPDINADNVHEYLYAESRRVLPAGHVYGVSAEREGLAMLPVMEKLLVMWKGQEGSLRALGDLLKEVDPGTLPHHQIGWGQVAGNSRMLAMQSVRVPG